MTQKKTTQDSKTAKRFLTIYWHSWKIAVPIIAAIYFFYYQLWRWPWPTTEIGKQEIWPVNFTCHLSWPLMFVLQISCLLLTGIIIFLTAKFYTWFDKWDADKKETVGAILGAIVFGFVGVIVGGIVGVIVGGIVFGFVGVIVGGIVGVIVGGIVGVIVGVIVGGIIEQFIRNLAARARVKSINLKTTLQKYFSGK